MSKDLSLSPAKLMVAEYGRTNYSAKIGAGVQYSDVKKSEYWVHVSKRLRSGDIIEVSGEKNNFYAKFFVVGHTNEGKILIEELLYKDFSNKTNKSEQGEYKVNENYGDSPPRLQVKYRGKAGFSVVQDGNSVLSEGHPTKEEAQKWLEIYEKGNE